MPTTTYDLIASNVLSSTATSVTFSSIPNTYRDLVLVMRTRFTSATNVSILYNSSTSGYSFVMAMGLGGGSTSTDAFGSRNSFEFFNAAPDDTGMAVIQILDYAQTNKHKTAILRNNRPTSFTQMLINRWADTSAINSIEIQATTFNSGSSFHLYGLVA